PPRRGPAQPVACVVQSAPLWQQVTIAQRRRLFLVVPLTTRDDLLPLALGPKLASLLVGLLVALRDLLTKFVEGRRRCRPSRAWFLNLLRHNAALLFAPQGRLATGRMRERGTRAVQTASHTL